MICAKKNFNEDISYLTLCCSILTLIWRLGMLVSSSSSALTGPGFFLDGMPAAAGCGEGGAASEEVGFILTPPSGSGNAGAEVEDG